MTRLILCLSYILAFNFLTAQDEFITTWETNTENDTITIPTLERLVYDYTIDWGDGTVEENVTGSLTHVYLDSGSYSVEISGNFPAIYFSNPQHEEGDNSTKIKSIDQWGSIKWQTMESAFHGCTNLTLDATDAPDLSNVESTRLMFASAESFNGDLSHWDVSNVRNMAYMFASAYSFNGNISTWDVSRVENMHSMFRTSLNFNSDISNWNVIRVTDMSHMFRSAVKFNQDISNWQVFNAKNMDYMFDNAKKFNQDISNWPIFRVESMNYFIDFGVFSSYNYDKMLETWSTYQLVENVTFRAIVGYCNQAEARQKIIDDFGWKIRDYGQNCDPTDIIISNVTIDENSPIATAIGALSSVDPDKGAKHSYSLDYDSREYFVITTTKELWARKSFDYETQNEYAIEITSDDGYGLFKKSFTIIINDVNDAPNEIRLSQNTIDENNSPGSLVGKLTAIDDDPNDTHTFSIAPADSSKFEVNGSDLFTKTSFDFEISPYHIIDIIAKDDQGLELTQTDTIFIRDLNEAPIDILLSNQSIDENTEASTIGFLSTVDDVGDTHTYTLSGTDAESFSVENDQLLSAEVFNYESKPTCTIIITTEDSLGAAYSKEMTIEIIDVNDAPTSISLSDSVLSENHFSNVLIGTFSTEDEDASDTFAYALTDESGKFKITDVNNLRTTRPIQFGSQNEYPITVVSTDGEGLSISQDFIIVVEEVLSSNQVKNLKIYPNPTSQLLHIESDNVEKIFVYDISGQLLKTVKTTNVLDVTDLNNGTYILELQMKNVPPFITKFTKK